jgi:hypothetical protein
VARLPLPSSAADLHCRPASRQARPSGAERGLKHLGYCDSDNVGLLVGPAHFNQFTCSSSSISSSSDRPTVA